jgi:AAA+ ATPase superfamily predicted ATPase
MKIQAGKPVTGKDLIGREKEISLIMAILLQGQSVILVAPRRFGKTSIVLEVLSRLKKENHFTAFIDIFTVPDIRHLSAQITENVLANKKLDALFKKMGKNLAQILKHIEFKKVIDEFEFVLSFATPGMDEWELLSDSIDFIESYSNKYNRLIFCGLDEFGDISKLDGDRIVKLFRSKIQLQKHSSYMFSGSSESMMDALFLKKNSPFYRLARVLEISYIDREDFFIYLKQSFKKMNLQTNDTMLNDILDFTKGHPYYTQLILQQINIRHQLDPGETNFKLEDLLEELLQLERNYLEKLWEDTSKRREHRYVVTKLAEEPDSLYSVIDHKSVNIPRTIKTLKGSGQIIRNEKGRYILSDPLFAYWIRKRVLKS